jgi:hypothetical protein
LIVLSSLVEAKNDLWGTAADGELPLGLGERLNRRVMRMWEMAVIKPRAHWRTTRKLHQESQSS